MELAKQSLTGEMTIPSLELASHPVLAEIGLSGNVEGGLSFELGPRRSMVEGLLSAKGIRGFGLILGGGSVRLRKTGSGLMAIESDDFFHGGRVLEDSSLQLGAYGTPRKIVLASLFRDLDGASLFPALSDADAEFQFDGKAMVAYDRQRKASPLVFRIGVDKGGLEPQRGNRACDDHHSGHAILCRGRKVGD